MRSRLIQAVGRLVPQLVWLVTWFLSAYAMAEPQEVCRAGKPNAFLIAPKLDGPTSDIVTRTLNGYLQRCYGWQLPTVQQMDSPGTYVVVGAPENNDTLKQLVVQGLRLDDAALGDEGFRIVTHESDQRRLIILHAKTAIALKHACQELVYFRMEVSKDAANVPWPLDVTMQPAIAYRACYMLPCWSAYDSLESWRRTLEFNSELTLNRNWFWLNGFPLLPQYGGIYHGTALSDVSNVRSLIRLCHNEGMKFTIGGGWFTWHHKESASGSAAERVAQVGAGGGEAPIELDEQGMTSGIQYYLDLLKALPEADGFYLEPTGEGGQANAAVWHKHVNALERLLKEVHRTRPEFESAIAIGRFNSLDYRQAIHRIAPDKLHWFWAWGNPTTDKALLEHPLILRWHTTQAMSEFHGSDKPPESGEAALTGMVTSWDPGMGFGNSWTGWAKIGVDRPRNFHPYTLPYFSHQYWFRERCWNLNLTEQQFSARLSKRLFDADMPGESIVVYLKLAALCPDPKQAERTAAPKKQGGPDSLPLTEIETFVRKYAHHGTARNQDTMQRMQEALDGIKMTSPVRPAP